MDGTASSAPISLVKAIDGPWVCCELLSSQKGWEAPKGSISGPALHKRGGFGRGFGGGGGWKGDMGEEGGKRDKVLIEKSK